MTEMMAAKDMNSDTALKTSFFFFGGCGKHMLDNVASILPENSKKVVFDARSEDPNKNATHAYVLGDGVGSGKERKKNASGVQKALTELNDLPNLWSDLNVFVFSLNGGSGSIIAPMALNLFLKEGKKCLLITISDATSLQDTDNSLTTVTSLYKISTVNKAFIPYICLDNYKSFEEQNSEAKHQIVAKTDEAGRKEVDNTFKSLMTKLVTILYAPTNDIDPADRMKFISGGDRGHTGLFPLIIKAGSEKLHDHPIGLHAPSEEELRNMTFSSMMRINAINQEGEVIENEVAASSLISFSGTFQQKHEHGTPYLALIGSNDTFLKNFKELYERVSKSISEAGKPVESNVFGSVESPSSEEDLFF